MLTPFAFFVAPNFLKHVDCTGRALLMGGSLCFGVGHISVRLVAVFSFYESKSIS